MKKSGITFIIILLSFFTMGLYGQNLYVDSASTCTSCNGQDWANAFPSLQDALTQASSGSIIFVAQGTYFPDEGTGISNNDRTASFEFPDSITVLGGYPSFGGTRDLSLYKAVLSGNIQQDNDSTNNSYSVVRTQLTTDQTIVDGFVIKDGQGDSNTYPYFYGGGWYNSGLTNSHSSPVIRNCIFTNNYAEDGGAIHNFANSKLKLINCVFYKNRAVNGGAVLNKSYANIYDISIINCSFASNSAKYGGALYNWGNTTTNATISNCIFWNNQAQYSLYGPQIYNYQSNYDYAVFNHCLIEGCNGSNWYYSLGVNGGNNLDFNPRFMDLENGDLHLHPCSEVVNMGSNTSISGITFDADGLYRIFDTNVDIGAYEHHGYQGFSVITNLELNQEISCSSPGAATVSYSSSNGPSSVLWDNGEAGSSANALSFGYHTVYVSNIASGCIDSSSIYIPLNHSGGIIYVDSAATGTGSGCSWENALNHLSDALIYAKAGDSIFVAKGTYYPDESVGVDSDNSDSSYVVPDSVALFGGFAPADSVLTYNQRNWHIYKTILSGNIHQGTSIYGNTYRIIKTENVSSATIIDGFTITKGNGYYASGCVNISTGNETCSPQIRNCIFHENYGTICGAIYNERNANPLILNCVFSENEGKYASSILNDAQHGSCNPNIINCTFSKNHGLDGGTVKNDADYGTCNPNYYNCIFWDNFNYQSNLPFINDNGANPNIAYSIIEEYHSGNWPVLMGTDGGNNLSFDPLFMNPLVYDFRLQICSKSINGGSNQLYPVGTSLDAQAAERIFNNNRIDMGAYENQGDGFVRIDSVSIIQQVNCTSFGMAELHYSIETGIENILWDNNEITAIADSLNGGWHQIILSSQANMCMDTIEAHIPATISGSRIYVDAGAMGINSGCNWENAFTDLQVALLNANKGDSILVAEGNYYPHSTDRSVSFYLRDSVKLFGGFSPVNGITEFETRDFRSYISVLNGDIQQDNVQTNNSYHVVYSEYVSLETIVDGFEIRNGCANKYPDEQQGGGWYNGGGSVNYESNPSIRNCRFVDNYAESYGGAFFNYAPKTSNPYFESCIFTANSSDDKGGAISLNKKVGIYGSSNNVPVFVNCLFYDNYSEYGGAIYNEIPNTPEFTNCTFSGNTALRYGGAIYNYHNENKSRYNNCIIWENICLDLIQYNEIYNNYAEPEFEHCIIEGCGGSSSWNSNTGVDMGSNIDQDPEFKDPNLRNYRIYKSSPAFESGIQYGITIPETDLDGNDRIMGFVLDRGCYELDPGNLSSQNNILSFSLPNQVQPTDIDTVNHRVEVFLPYNTNTSDLVASFELSYGARAYVNNMIQENGITHNNFTDSLIYKIKAEDLSVQDWIVKVQVLQSIEERNGKPEILLYPNPVNDKVYISSMNLFNKLLLYDVHGKLLIQTNIQSTHTELNIASICKGIYILKVVSGDETSIHKIIKE